ncbi:MAG: hypothetical protein JNL08_12940 [Planctomycetes bacterium]|nr:hypothetical protein [Planctomycetota bacterium]
MPAAAEDPSRDPPWLVSVATAAQFFATPLRGEHNAVRWRRSPAGDFAELAQLAAAIDAADRVPLDETILLDLRRHASLAGSAAIDRVLADLALLRDHGHEPSVELLRRYERDPDPDLPIDVHSFHVDTANAATETILCTYFGAPSEVLARADALRCVDEPTLRARLWQRFGAGDDPAFAAWLAEHAFDLHYRPREGAAPPFAFGRGELCRLAVEHPFAAARACVHRAPPHDGVPRLLLIS